MRYSGYSYNHWKGCMCDSCAAVFRAHNPQAPNIIGCGCDGCQSRHREQQQALIKDGIAQTIPSVQTGGKTMSGIHVCEREGCEAFMKGSALGGLILTLNSDMHGQGNAIRLEICPGCVKDIHDIISIAPLSHRERSYSKPYSPDSDQAADAVSDMTDEQLAATLFQRLMAKGGGVKELLSRAHKDDE